MAEQSPDDLIQVKHKDRDGTTTVPRSAFDALWSHRGFVEVKADEGLTIHDVRPDTGNGPNAAPDAGDGLDGLTVDELKALVPEGVTPASGRKADLVAAIRTSREA